MSATDAGRTRPVAGIEALGMRLEGRHALVSGGSRGIGRAIAEELADRGARVTITSTGGPVPEWCAGRDDVMHAPLDLLDPASVDAFARALEGGELGAVDILVNNAGRHRPQPADAIDPAALDELMRINLAGPMRLMRAAAPGMIERGHGRILNVASIAAFVARPGSGAYAATKGGLVGLTRAAALDLAPYGILVNALCPGYARTDMAERVLTEEQRQRLVANVPLGRLAEPEEIARFAAFLVSELNTYVTGQAVVVDGGVTAQ